MTSVYQSRWGYHPCDYETFQLLKKLNAFFEQARRRYGEWKRWSRKQPQNRVLRKTLVDEQGRKIGRQILGPRPEPALCPIFCQRDKVVRRWSKDDRHIQEAGELVHLKHCDIPESYRAARTPAPSPEQVTPLRYSLEEIRSLVAQTEEWFRSAK